jgi:hypothetical protein
VNDPPSITLPEERSAFENSLYTGVLEVHDVDGGDNLTLTPQTMPSWLNFNPTTNTLYGTPLSTNIGNNFVRMRASDGKATVDSSFYIIVINVNHPPVITSLPKTQGDDYKLYSYSIEATDPDNDAVIYTPILIPSWAQFNSSSGNLSGTPRFFDTGNFSVSLMVSDGFEDTTQNFVITVTNLNDKPQFVSSPDTIAIMNVQYTYTVEVSDVDEDDILSVSAIALPSWLTYFDQARILIGRPKESNLGKALVAFGVSDGKDVSEQVFYVNVKETSLIKYSYQDENIMVYPNPAESYFTIVSSQGKLALVELYDLKGQCVISRKLSSVNNEVQVNDFSLLPGVYFYKIVTSSASCYGKIVLK